MEKKYLTAKELAIRWNFRNERKIYKMKDRGEIPYTEFGGSIRFALEDIEEYERSHRIVEEPDEETVNV